MLKINGLLIIVLLFAFALSASAEDFSDCGVLGVDNTVYELTDDISAVNTCLTIGGSNITVDCAGHTITYATSGSGYGIFSSTKDGITVENCNIVQGSNQTDAYAIYLSASSDSTLANNNLTVNGSYNIGIRLMSVSGSDIYNNNISAHGNEAYGINALSSYENRISGNTISLPDSISYDGIGLGDESDYNNITNNYVFCGGRNAYGFGVYQGAHNTLLNNTIDMVNELAYGIYIGSMYTSAINNTISLIGDYSFGVYDSYPYCNLAGNTLSLSGLDSYGIYLDGSGYCNLSDNSVDVDGRSSYALHLDYGASNNRVSDSEFTSLYSYAVYLNDDGDVPYSNLFYNNLFNGSEVPVGFSSELAAEAVNYWNTSSQGGERIFSEGALIGGNYYTNSSGTGFSDACEDLDGDGFCDYAYDVFAGASCEALTCGDNTDYLPYSDELWCELPGDYSPCGDVSLREVVDYIQLWVSRQVPLADVVRLINAWVSPN